jgi:hypothetical protein
VNWPGCTTSRDLVVAKINAQARSYGEPQNFHLSNWFFLLAFPQLQRLQSQPKRQLACSIRRPRLEGSYIHPLLRTDVGTPLHSLPRGEASPRAHLTAQHSENRRNDNGNGS